MVISPDSSINHNTARKAHYKGTASWFSVKEYLTSDRLANANGDVSPYHIIPESAHTILAQAFLGVLFRFGYQIDEDTAEDNLLTMYAAKHWVDHARFKDVSSRIRDAMECFFDADKLHFAAWHRVHDIDDECFLSLPGDVPRGGPLYYASLCGFYDVAKHLVVKHPEHVNARGGQFISPLGAALNGEHLQVAELLYDHDADARVRGGMILHLSTRSGSVDATCWLLNHGADANVQNDGGWTPLHMAAWNKHLEIVQILLDHHADIHAQSHRGEVALHHAACHHSSPFHINVLQLLLDRGADVNARDNEGSTPLHHSSFTKHDLLPPSRGSVEGIRLLLEYGASIDAKNIKGETPSQVALEENNHEMVDFLSGLGVDL